MHMSYFTLIFFLLIKISSYARFSLLLFCPYRCPIISLFSLSLIFSLQRRKFSSYVNVPPIDLFRLDPAAYMMIVGVVELVCVGLLLFGRSRLGLLSTWALLVIMVGALYTHLSMRDTLQDMGGAIAGLGFVLTRLYTMGAFSSAERRLKFD